MDLIMIVASAIVLIVVVVITSVGIIQFDLMSYMATDTEFISPTGTSAGHALVLYDPGVSGATKSISTKIADDLKSKSYTVDLAGVRSLTAANISDYSVIIVGGPMYFGKVSRSIDTYLKTLPLQKEVKLGVFATTGSNDFVAEDLTSLENQVTSLQSGDVAIKLIRDRDEKKAIQDYKGLVSTMIQWKK